MIMMMITSVVVHDDNDVSTRVRTHTPKERERERGRGREEGREVKEGVKKREHNYQLWPLLSIVYKLVKRQ